MAQSSPEKFVQLVLRNSVNQALLARLPELHLPDWYIVAGCLCQSVWNAIAGFSPTDGIADYDVFYHDLSDLSWEAEDAVIKRCNAVFSDLGVYVQVRNQARVHLWYPEKYGAACPRLVSSRDGIDGFLSQASCLGLRTEPDGTYIVYAPFGFDDVFGMVVRPNRRRNLPSVYYEKTTRWLQVWPTLTVLPWVENAAQV
jgi:hypothetical protein